MGLFLLAAFINFTLIITGQYHRSSSSLYKNGKMYIYDSTDVKYDEPFLYVYTLKDGPISDIKPNIVSITNLKPAYAPKFLNLPPRLSNGRSDQLWMMRAIAETELNKHDVEQDPWTVQIVNDNEFRPDSSFIPKPDYKKFPERKKETLITNCQFKYEFKTDTWSDISHRTKSKLPPIAYHRVVQAENSLIIVGGNRLKNIKNNNFNDTVSTEDTDRSSLADIYKFDLSTEEWSLEKAKLNLNETLYKGGKADGLSLDIYNEKLITYASLMNAETEMYNPMIGTLDYKAKEWEWTWIEVKNAGGTDNNLNLMFHHTLVINDQLLMFHGFSNQANSDKQMYSIDLKTNNLIGTVNISGNNEKSTDSRLLTWAIILISVICAVVFILILVSLWFYLRYKKRIKSNEKNSQKMQDVWATSEVEMDRNKKVSTALNIGTSASSPEQTGTTLKDDFMADHSYFQHEVDLQDMHDTKIAAKI
ncbi:hypothetical protein CONCODRAFT_10956 [Conidiobolus coronatus NRRL 28638]|uniref:Galactose oxidase n=1 Tax=Conidiobolus coronatus (strain ATCC 28846 / CBS 209.66 / NRRL 28638) TaxID=796925 RepID=A0A137NWB2_CONC2|nr:hypothetical protein CONCODRAFT_10956 [Conidiobolus coronatus NRRL 28638]|eukprot:KXN67062.1 hypothetical protein CONCODRAFT_10956 [Conidiobolus coronatus NRRL 28638]